MLTRPPPRSTLFPYTTLFRSATGVESDLIQTMVIARWRLNRIAGIETSLFNNQIDRKSTRLNLQSHSDLVCRLLLEKKKGHTTRSHPRKTDATACPSTSPRRS